VPSAPAKLADVLLFDAMLSEPPLKTQADDGSCVLPLATPMLLRNVSPCVWPPSVK